MSTFSANRPTWAEINLDRLADNYRSIKNFVGKDIEYMAVVKADAYGHGAVECARRLESEKIEWLGVALPEEGLELRNNGIKTPILCLGSFWAGQEKCLIDNDLTPVIFDLKIAELYNRAAAENRCIADVHIKVDTGMGRIGVRFDQVPTFAERFREFENLRVQGLMTHFAAADDLSENVFTNEQISRFEKASAVFQSHGFQAVYRDLANSPAAVAHPSARGNLVRIGGILYGLGDDVLPAAIPKPHLQPVMSLHARITQLKNVPAGETLGYGRTFRTVRDSVIAAVPIGYQDGYNRLLSNHGRVLVRNQTAPAVGRISMDWTMIDVTDVADIQVNDEVILIGESGELKVSAEELALQTGTISYEITCGINRRVVREYVDSEKNRWFEKIFTVYNRNLLRRRFQHFRVGGAEFLPRKDGKTPLIIYANHSGWWDGLVIFDVQMRFGLEHYVLMEEKNLRNLPLFRRLGAFSVVRENPRAAARSINYAAELLRAGSNRALTVFPQGEILPNDARPLHFYPGIAAIIGKVGACSAVPMALRYEFLGDYKPEIFVKIGAPDVFSAEENFNRKTLTDSLARRLTETLDGLKQDIISRETNDYQTFFNLQTLESHRQ